LDKQWLIDKYNELGSLTDIAKEIGTTKQAVRYWFNKYEIPRSSAAEVARKRCTIYSYNEDFFEIINTEEKDTATVFLDRKKAIYDSVKR
jgi:predicted DNA-binding protein YlxM (UPF0122 family)